MNATWNYWLDQDRRWHPERYRKPERHDHDDVDAAIVELHVELRLVRERLTALEQRVAS